MYGPFVIIKQKSNAGKVHIEAASLIAQLSCFVIYRFIGQEVIFPEFINKKKEVQESSGSAFFYKKWTGRRQVKSETLIKLFELPPYKI